MTRELSQFGYPEAEFAADGELIRGPAPSDVTLMASGRRPTDLILLVHGWNNTPATARVTYAELARSLREVHNGRPLAGRTLALAGILWPSSKWDWFGADGRDAGRARCPPRHRTKDPARRAPGGVRLARCAWLPGRGQGAGARPGTVR